MTPDPISNSIENPDKIITEASQRQNSSWDIRNAPKNYLSLVLSQIGSAVFSFAAVWLITRNLGSEGYGGIVAIIAASQVAQILVNWTSVAVVRFGVDEFIDTEKISRTFWVRLFILMVNLAIVLSLAGFWFPPIANWLMLSPNTFWLVIIHFAVSAFWVHIQMSLQGAKMPRVQGFLQMIERLLILAGFLILIAVGRLDFFLVIICYIAAPAAMILIGLYQIRSYIFSHFSIDRQFIKKIVAYSAPLTPMALVVYLAGSYLDAIFISQFLSIRELGIYSVATQINGIVLQLPTLAGSIVLPLFITLQKESRNEKTLDYFRNVLPSMTLLWGMGCTALAFVAYFAVPMVFGMEFQGASLPFWILLTATSISLPALVGYFPLVHSVSATYISLVGASFSAIVNVVANLILIPKYGLMGCAWATALSYLINVVVTSILLKRDADAPFSWNFVALLPAFSAGICASITQNVSLSIALCLAFTLLLLYFKWDSISAASRLLLNLRPQLKQRP